MNDLGYGLAVLTVGAALLLAGGAIGTANPLWEQSHCVEYSPTTGDCTNEMTVDEMVEIIQGEP